MGLRVLVNSLRLGEGEVRESGPDPMTWTCRRCTRNLNPLIAHCRSNTCPWCRKCAPNFDIPEGFTKIKRKQTP